jgi:UDP-N-acetylglucosamine 2-epimerase (non-hydrolysing)
VGRAEPVRGGLLCVVGARPNYMKMAPLLRAFARTSALPPPILVHTGQHYDFALNDRLFDDLQLPAPDINLGVGSGSHAVQTAEVMRRFEPVVDELAPRCVIVVGDVNSTLACSLVAAKKAVPVVHVEAGLRSHDRTMPEEINRVLTDQLADQLYTTERDARSNLLREGIAEERIHFVGNLMIDSLLHALPRAVPPATTLADNGFDRDLIDSAQGYAVATIHRPSNVDQPSALREVLALLDEVAAQLPLIWPMHPRTHAALERAGWTPASPARLVVLPPQGYLQMLGLLREARLVLTDSGGIQEETTALAVPCLTLRENTERPITVELGSNTVIGRDSQKLRAELGRILTGQGKRGAIPEGWDGRAADRVADHLAAWLAKQGESVRVQG